MKMLFLIQKRQRKDFFALIFFMEEITQYNLHTILFLYRIEPHRFELSGENPVGVADNI